jgi:hypothetical protein
MKIILLLLLKLSLLASIGNIMAIKGSADIQHGDSKKAAKSGMSIEEGDSIVTGKKSRVQVMLKDETVVTIGAKSLFEFEEYLYDTSKKSKVTMRASRGFFRSVTGKIGKLAPERFKVKTASATIGIRGTDFSGEIFGDREIFKCYSGAITVEYDGGSQDIDAGMMAEIRKDTDATTKEKSKSESKSKKSESKAKKSEAKSKKSESKSGSSSAKSKSSSRSTSKSSAKPKGIVVKSISSADVSSQNSGETTVSSEGSSGKSISSSSGSSTTASPLASEVSSPKVSTSVEVSFDNVDAISSTLPDVPTEAIADVTQIVEDKINIPIPDGTAEPIQPGDDTPVYIPTGAVSQ